MKRFIISLFIAALMLFFGTSLTQAQQRNFRTSAPAPQPEDSVTKLSVRFVSGTTRNGASLQVISPSVRSVLLLYGITDDRITAQFPGSPQGQQLQQNELGEYYSTPDLSKIAVLTLPNPSQAAVIMQSLRSLAEVGAVSPFFERQIERDHAYLQ